MSSASEPVSNQTAEDLKKYLSFKIPDPIDIKEHYRFMDSLSRERKINLARELLHNEVTLISYHGCSTLIFEGIEDETVPILAEMVATGKVQHEFENKIGWNWYHQSDDQTLFPRMLIKISEYLLKNIKVYSDDREKYVMNFFDFFLECEGDHSKNNIKSKIKGKRQINCI
ncbi:MAG TPA: hypothetical protein DEG92_05185, partial [Rikenellaceae bacterium]|nr:hypothetical protein [Rikenellaceae bacterium]